MNVKPLFTHDAFHPLFIFLLLGATFGTGYAQIEWKWSSKWPQTSGLPSFLYHCSWKGNWSAGGMVKFQLAYNTWIEGSSNHVHLKSAWDLWVFRYTFWFGELLLKACIATLSHSKLNLHGKRNCQRVLCLLSRTWHHGIPDVW